MIHQLLLQQYYSQDQELPLLAWWKKEDQYRNPSSEYHSSSFYSSMEIVRAVVVRVASVFCFGPYYLHHSEDKKRNLYNSSKSRTFGIRALIV